MSDLTFAEFSRINYQRCLRWHKGGLTEWSLSDWGTAAGGEMGEVLDAIKKWNRIRDGVHSNNPRQPHDFAKAEAAIKKEIGDTGVYLDLLAQRLGTTLGECMVEVFNSISEREGHPEKVKY